MRQRLSITIAMAITVPILAVTPGCDSWVEDVEPSGRIITDDLLTREDQVEPLMTGVLREFSITNSQLALATAALSDELFHNPDYPNNDLGIIDGANIPLDNRFVRNRHTEIGRLRFLADDLIRRIGEIEFQDPELRQRAAFTGYFYGGVARFYLAAEPAS